jgi:hypothetical protein
VTLAVTPDHSVKIPQMLPDNRVRLRARNFVPLTDEEQENRCRHNDDYHTGHKAQQKIRQRRSHKS